MSIDDIVNVQITRETKAVTRQGFSTTLILGVNKAFASLQRVYGKQSEVLEDFQSTDKEALASGNLFSQSPAPVNVVIGRRATSDTTVVTVTTVLNTTTYSITLNGTKFEFTSDADATAVEIAAGLKIAVDAGSEPIAFTDNIDGTYDIDPTVPSTDYSIKVDANQTTVFATSDTPANDLANIQTENNDWYGLVYTLRTEAEILLIAAWVETDKKLYGVGDSDANIINVVEASDTTSIPAQLKALGYARTFTVYGSNAATQYPEAALLGTVLPLDPGSWSAAYQNLSSIIVDSLSSSQRANALAKNTMIYTEVGGANITEDGRVAEGEWIDIIVFVDWIDARMTENIYSLLVNQPKLPFTDQGISAIEAEITGVLQDGQALGGITLDPGFSVQVPEAVNVSQVDKINRTLNGITFEATLSGAIHIINILGTVTV